MNIPKDPVMLVSFLNLKLRDNYASFDALCGSEAQRQDTDRIQGGNGLFPHRV